MNALALVSAPLPVLATSYAAMLEAVEQVATVTEAVELVDQTDALAVLARAARDPALLTMLAEIRLRASLRIGEIVANLAKSRPLGHGQHRLPASGRTKVETIRAAGLSVGHALHLESLAGGQDRDRRTEVRHHADAFFADRRARQQPATLASLERWLTGDPGPQRPRRRSHGTDRRADTGPAVAEAPYPAATPPQPAPDTPQAAGMSLTFAGLVAILANVDDARLHRIAALVAQRGDLATLRQHAEAAEATLSRWTTMLVCLSPRVAGPRDAPDHMPRIRRSSVPAATA